MTRLAFAHARASGIATAPLLDRAGLSQRQIEDPKTRIRVRDQVEFLNLIGAATKDDLLGFHLAQHCELRAVGLYYYVLASSESVRDVCERCARYSGLINEGVTQQFVDGAQIGIRTRFTSASRYEDRHQVEFWTVALVRMLRHFTGKRLVPESVSFMHPRKRAIGEMTRYFGCRVKFDAPIDEVIFAKGAGELPVVNADPYLNRVLLAICEETLARGTPSRGLLRTQVENEIALLLPHGKARATFIARRLGVSPRSLARHLAGEGTSFSELLGAIRRDLAGRYLEDEGLPISQIAWLLGFRDPGAFSHAFKRWYGTSPRHSTARVR
jgi:AraC-like DNA-binding protein